MDFDAGSWWSYLLVFVAAAIPVLEILVVIPAAIVAGLHPIPTTVLALAGNWVTVAVVVLVGDRLVRWWQRRRQERRARRHEDTPPRRRKGAERAGRIVRRWGLPALAVLAPVTTGTHVAALAALAIGGTRRRVLVWMTVGLAAWAVVAAVVTANGLELLT